MIEFRNVSFHYGGENGTGEGVDNISLTIQRGEVVVLCGRSGCGKTTVTRLVNGLAPHFFPGELEGEVWVDDLCVSKAPLSDTSRRVGSVFQNPKSQFFNVDSTGELVFGCENFGMERAEIHRRLDKTVEDILENGRIVEQGSHDELMVKNGAYCHMIGLQERMSSWNQGSDTAV